MSNLASRLLTFSLPVAALLSGCNGSKTVGALEPVEPNDDVITAISLADFDADIEVTRGINIDPRTGDFVFLTNRGILHVDRSGDESKRIDIESGITIPEWGTTVDTLAFGDIASLGDGTYALPMENMVRRYNPETNEAEDYFCLLPGMPLQQMHNDAIAINLADNEIIASPLITEDGATVSNNLVRYRASDASFDSASPISDELHPQGLAIDSATNQVIAVEGNRIHLLTREGEVLMSAELNGVTAASGVAISDEDDLVFVLDDTTNSMVAFELSGFTQ